MTQQHPDLAAEQDFIEHAYRCLEVSRDAAWRMRNLHEGTLGGTFQARYESDVFDEAVVNRLTHLDPIPCFAVETAAATVLEIAPRLGFPLSTTHVISSTILGVGASRRLNAVHWNVAGRIAQAWVLTLPICAALGWLAYIGLHMIT